MIPELRVEVPAACQKGIRFCNGFPAEVIPHAFSLFPVSLGAAPLRERRAGRPEEGAGSNEVVQRLHDSSKIGHPSPPPRIQKPPRQAAGDRKDAELRGERPGKRGLIPKRELKCCVRYPRTRKRIEGDARPMVVTNAAGFTNDAGDPREAGIPRLRTGSREPFLQDLLPGLRNMNEPTTTRHTMNSLPNNSLFLPISGLKARQR